MKPGNVDRLTALCTASAILSALLFDRVTTLRIPIAAVGTAAALVAVVAYFRSTGVMRSASDDTGVVAAAVRTSETGAKDQAATSWQVTRYAWPRVGHRHEQFIDARVFHALNEGKYLAFNRDVVLGLLDSAIVDDAVAEMLPSHIGNYEVLITPDGLFAVRQIPAHKRFTATALDRANRRWQLAYSGHAEGGM
jgi:hypothetical protein